MTILPAIDLKGGVCVRLRQGRADDVTTYNADPAAQARDWRDQGGEELHVVDLDGAFAGTPRHAAVIGQIISACGGPVAVGGGWRTPEALKAQSYFDCAHLARTIKCDVYVCTGFADEGCPPSCVYGFYNAIPEGTKKVISTNPKTGHYGTTANVGGNARIDAFFKAAKIGEVPSEVK